MATRCRFGLMLDDGTVKHSYCHWDGYPEGVGSTLVFDYKNVEKIEELLSFGDLSVMDAKIYPEGEHNFDNPEKGVCVFYNRDRGETDVDAVVSTIEEYQSVKYFSGMNFLYLFSGNNWWFCNTNKKDKWELVKKFLPDFDLTPEDLSCSISL